MEAIATDPGRLVPPRDRDDLGHAWKVVMEGRIEARHLRQLGIEELERLNRPDLAGQMVGVVRDDPAKLGQDLGRNELRPEEAVAAVNHTMTDDGDVFQTDQVSEQLDQHTHGRRLIRDLDRTLLVPKAIGVGHDQPGPGHPDPLDTTGQEALRPVGRCEQPELETRRAAVDRQDAGSVTPLRRDATRPRRDLLAVESHGHRPF